jgi:hypothetical protein
MEKSHIAKVFYLNHRAGCLCIQEVLSSNLARDNDYSQ